MNQSDLRNYIKAEHGYFAPIEDAFNGFFDRLIPKKQIASLTLCISRRFAPS